MTQLPYPATKEEADLLKKSWRGKHTLKRIEYMRNKFGESDGHYCGDCKHFRRYQMSNTYFKCALYGTSGSVATDWRARWEACGKWEKIG